MDASDVIKDMIEQTNNVTTRNETNNEPGTVSPNRFTFIYKIPCIHNKCSTDMYIVLGFGSIMFFMGIIGNVYTLVKICRSNLHKSTTYACILMLVISDIIVLLLCPFRFSVFVNSKLYHNAGPPRLVHLLCATNLTYIPVFWSAINAVYFAYERFFLIRYPHLYFVHHTSKKIVVRSVVTLLIAISIFTSVITGVHFVYLKRESVEASIASFVVVVCSVNFLIVLILIPLFHKSKIQHLQDQGTGQRYEEMASSTTKRITVILIIHIVSQIPGYAYVWVKFYDTLHHTNFSSRMITIIVGFYHINFSINPYIYFIIKVKCACLPS